MASIIKEYVRQTIETLAARATIDPNTPIRVSSPEFARVSSLLTGEGFEWMPHSDGIDSFGLPGHQLLYLKFRISRIAGDAVANSKAVSAFLHDCWALYAANSAFQVDSAGHLNELLGYQIEAGGHLDMKRHLKRIEVKINVDELREEEYYEKEKLSHGHVDDDFIIEDDNEDGALNLSDGDKNAEDGTMKKLDMFGKVRMQLGELFECTNLHKVVILVDGGSKEQSNVLVMKLIEQAVLPVVEHLRRQVQFVHVGYACSWSSLGQAECWRPVMSGDSKQNPDMLNHKRLAANIRRRAKQFEDVF